MIAICKGHRASIQQKADFSHFPALPAFGQGGHWQNIDGGVQIGAPARELERFGGIDRGQCIGAGDDGCHAARGSCLTG